MSFPIFLFVWYLELWFKFKRYMEIKLLIVLGTVHCVALRVLYIESSIEQSRGLSCRRHTTDVDAPAEESK